MNKKRTGIAVIAIAFILLLVFVKLLTGNEPVNKHLKPNDITADKTPEPQQDTLQDDNADIPNKPVNTPENKPEQPVETINKPIRQPVKRFKPVINTPTNQPVVNNSPPDEQLPVNNQTEQIAETPILQETVEEQQPDEQTPPIDNQQIPLQNRNDKQQVNDNAGGISLPITPPPPQPIPTPPVNPPTPPVNTPPPDTTPPKTIHTLLSCKHHLMSGTDRKIKLSIVQDHCEHSIDDDDWTKDEYFMNDFYGFYKVRYRIEGQTDEGCHYMGYIGHNTVSTSRYNYFSLSCDYSNDDYQQAFTDKFNEWIDKYGQSPPPACKVEMRKSIVYVYGTYNGLHCSFKTDSQPSNYVRSAKRYDISTNHQNKFVIRLRQHRITGDIDIGCWNARFIQAGGVLKLTKPPLNEDCGLPFM